MSMISDAIAQQLAQQETPDQFVYRAAAFSDKCHEGQTIPFNGLPYNTHVMELVFLMSRVTDNHHVLAATWMHDTVRMGRASYEELSQQFGFIVAGMVRAVTENRDDFMAWLKVNQGNTDVMHLVISDLISVIRLEAVHDWVSVRKAISDLEQVLFQEGLDPRLTRVAEVTVSETKMYLENVIGNTPLDVTRISTGHPSTLGVYRMMATQAWGPLCPAVTYLSEKITAAPNGVSELVLESETDMVSMLQELNNAPAVSTDLQ